MFVSFYHDNNVDKDLSAIAVSMGNNFQSEIKKVDKELTYLSETYGKELIKNKHKLVDNIKGFDFDDQYYPYFDMVAWINYNTGKQEFKLLMKRKKTSLRRK